MKFEKGTFVVIPNKFLLEGMYGHLQSVYFWLCNHADEKGLCFPSRATLARKAGVSIKTIDRAIEHFCEIGLISKRTRAVDGKNLTNVYQLNVLEGGGVYQRLGGVPQSLGVATDSRTELNPILTQSTERLVYTSESKDSQRVIVVEEREDAPQRQRKDTTYLQVFDLWGKYPLNWKLRKAQIQAAKNLLEEHTLDGTKKALAFAQKFKDDPYCPEITSPYDLDSKWLNLLAFKNKRA